MERRRALAAVLDMIPELKEQMEQPVTSEPQAKQATHDIAPPPALLDFMRQQWKPPPAKAPAPVKYREAFLERRRALSSLFPGETLIIPTGSAKGPSNDRPHPLPPG